MTPDRWTRMESIFNEALALEPAARAAFLDAACLTPDGVPDDDLRIEVDRILDLDDGAETFFDRLRDDVVGDEAPAPLASAGPWRLLERVGIGGMGEVWRAERADGAYEQIAAVKLVRPGLGDELLARFRAERSVLARLNHPSIARLLDGGQASDGRPYLALEFVDGEPITAYADRMRLSVAGRIDLFRTVCDAVDAAHRQLVVHRDIKPSNVLVTPDGVVKLLDFGIAKLLDADDTGAVQTAADQRVMTPEYAAPEQVRGEAPTTATDVYGLGVLLFELLTGTRPYRLESKARQAVERAILEDEPTGPSTAVSGVADAAEARGTVPTRLRKQLQGDIDQIVLKALRKDPGRRYGNAAALGADLGRHQKGLPVEAQPESAAYRVGKFIQRHRLGAGAATFALLAVLVGAGVALWQAAEADAQRRVATDRAAEANAVTEFLAAMVGDARPAGSDGDTLRVRDVLDNAVARLDTSFADQPLVRAALAYAFGRSYGGLAQPERAVPLFRQAVELRRRHLGRVDSLTMVAEGQLTSALFNADSLDAADVFLRDVLAVRTKAFGAWHVNSVKVLIDLGTSARLDRTDSVRHAGAEQFYLRALAVTNGPDSTRFVESMTDGTPPGVFRSDLNYGLASFYLETSQTEKALTPMRLAVQLSDEPLSALTRQILENGYGVLLRQLERYDESIAVHRRVVAAARAAFGPDHPSYGYPLLSLGTAQYLGDRPSDAVTSLREALRVFGGPAAEGETALDVRYYFGEALVDAGQVAEGRGVLRAALPALAREYGADNVRVRNARKTIAGG